MMSELESCIPGSKHDIEAVERARNAGYPAINPILPDLLEWLQDMNWPVAAPVADLLRGAGMEIVPPIRAIFAGEDHVWKYGLLMNLIPRLDASVRGALDDDIARMAKHPTQAECLEEVDIAAREVFFPD